MDSDVSFLLVFPLQCVNPNSPLIIWKNVKAESIYLGSISEVLVRVYYFSAHGDAELNGREHVTEQSCPRDRGIERPRRHQR